MSNLAPYAKALVPLFIGFVFMLVEPMGITPDMNAGDALTALVMALGVYLVPNKQA